MLILLAGAQGMWERTQASVPSKRKRTTQQHQSDGLWSVHFSFPASLPASHIGWTFDLGRERRGFTKIRDRKGEKGGGGGGVRGKGLFVLLFVLIFCPGHVFVGGKGGFRGSFREEIRCLLYLPSQESVALTEGTVVGRESRFGIASFARYVPRSCSLGFKQGVHHVSRAQALQYQAGNPTPRRKNTHNHTNTQTHNQTKKNTHTHRDKHKHKQTHTHTELGQPFIIMGKTPRVYVLSPTAA